MIPDNHIDYNGKRYPVFLVNIVDQSTVSSAQNMETIQVPVSTESLRRELIDKPTGAPVSTVASFIDDSIFFYIPDALATKNGVEIADFVSDNCW